MLSVLRPIQSNVVYGHPFGQRYFVEESLQTKKRRKDQISVIHQPAPISHAPVAASGPLVRQHPFQEFTQNMVDYFALLETTLISDFLQCDKCFKVSDNYALSMVFIYFIRAEFSSAEYTRENFFVALYLALDMEDDDQEFKYELFPWCLGKDWKRTYPLFLERRDKLWKRINYRALCSKATCDDIMRILPSPHWSRVRDENHGGAIRKCRQPPHPNNDLPVGPFGTPVPCVHCIVNKEKENLILKVERSSSSSDAKIEDDIFFSAEAESFSMGSGSSCEIFTDVKTEDIFNGSNLSSSGYRDRPAALNIDTEEDDDVKGGDDDEEDDDILWVNSTVDCVGNESATVNVSLSDSTRDIFAPSSSDDEIEVATKDRKCRDDNILSDIFWDSSDDSDSGLKPNGEEPLASPQSIREPRRAQRSFSRINLRDPDIQAKRLSPIREIFSTEI